MIKTSWLVPLTLSLLLTSIGTLAIRARKRHGFGPLLAGAFAAAIIMIGKFYLDNIPTIYSGAAILMAASLWNGWPKGKANDDAECRC